MLFWKKVYKWNLLILLFSSFESDWICPAAAKDNCQENQTEWTEEQGVGTDLVLISNLKKSIPINFIHNGAFLLQLQAPTQDYISPIRQWLCNKEQGLKTPTVWFLNACVLAWKKIKQTHVPATNTFQNYSTSRSDYQVKEQCVHFN